MAAEVQSLTKRSVTAPLQQVQSGASSVTVPFAQQENTGENCKQYSNFMLVNIFLQKYQLHTTLLYVFLQLQLLCCVNFFPTTHVFGSPVTTPHRRSQPWEMEHTGMARALQALANSLPPQGLQSDA